MSNQGSDDYIEAAAELSIKFEEGVVTIGGDDEFFVTVNDDYESLTLNSDRLELIHRLQVAQKR